MPTAIQRAPAALPDGLTPIPEAAGHSPRSFAELADNSAPIMGYDLMNTLRAQTAQRDRTGLAPPLWPIGVAERLRLLLLLGFLAQLAAGQTTQPAEEGAPANLAATLAVEPPHGPAQVARTETGLLDVHAREMEISTLLETLSYEARANIVTSTSVTGRVSANLYAVSLDQALEAILTPNKYVFCTVGSTVFVGTPEEIAVLRPPPLTRVFRLRYISPSEAAAAVKAVLGADAVIVEGGGQPKAGAAAGTPIRTGGSGGAGMEGSGAGFDYLIVTAPAERLAAAARLLAELEQRPKEVLIEATILRATLNEANQLGIDFMLLGGVDFQGVGSTSNAGADLRTGALPRGQLQGTTVNANTKFTDNVIGGGFTFGIIHNNFAAFIRALEEVTDVVVVANPKIVSLNKQEGEVIVGRRDGYLTTTVTQTAAIQTVEYLETGTQLKFRPTINEDGTVRLSVHPKDSNGGLTAANLPFEETTEAHADILLNDGDTILIGGLFRERTVGSKSQVPLLGDIPGAGLLLQSRNDQTIREEVIILLTVHILKETEQEHDQFRQLLDDVERIRIGSRVGLLGIGRERLAQAHYHEALRQLEQGDAARALLNVHMTLNNQPKHVGALKLKERLLGQRLWDDEGSRMRTLIWDLIGAERPVGSPPPAPPFGRPVVQPDAVSPTEDESQP